MLDGQEVVSRIRGWLKEEVACAMRDKKACPRYSGGWNYAQGRLDLAKDLTKNLKELTKPAVLPGPMRSHGEFN